MPTQKPTPDKTPADKATIDSHDGQQQDDNIDDLGRDVNDPRKKPVDQPTGKSK